MPISFAKMFWVSNKKLSFDTKADRKEKWNDESLVKLYYTTNITLLDIYTGAELYVGLSAEDLQREQESKAIDDDTIMNL